MQSINHVLMIKPANFSGNEQTATTNYFQQRVTATNTHLQALLEFEQLKQELVDHGITVNVIDDTAEPHKPDAIFPNNWVSFHADGTVVLYPMMAVNRRLERRMDVLQQLSDRGYHIKQLIDLSSHEVTNQYLEGTGSMVLDRNNSIAYASLSPRTHIEVLDAFTRRLDYELIMFEARDAQGQAIYHTNVLMCVGTRFAVVCMQAIAEPQRAVLLHSLQSTGHVIVDISLQQMQCFAGNMLELQNDRGEICIAMSQSAFNCLPPAQLAQLQSLSDHLVVAPIPTIEKQGGGSVRCMLSEVFIPIRS